VLYQETMTMLQLLASATAAIFAIQRIPRAAKSTNLYRNKFRINC